MSWEDREDTTIYRAVVDWEGKFQAWPFHEEIRRGWRDTGMSGTQPEVIAWIRQYSR